MNLFTAIAVMLISMVAIYLAANCLYLLFFAIAGHKKMPLPLRSTERYRRFAILMPVYQADEVILQTAPAALSHSYAGRFDVIVIADHLKQQTISKLQEMGCRVMPVAFENSTKGKALEYALQQIHTDAYDAALVLDVDNIMSAHVLDDINRAMEAGYKVVQAHRTAKNKSTPVAFLDACNEEVNNHTCRRAPFVLGLSPALIGSGMAIEIDYFKKLMHQIGDTVGEDKEMDFRMAIDGERVYYLHHTIVYDEKVSALKAFQHQRARWMAAQWTVLKRYTPQLVTQMMAGNTEFLIKLAHIWLLPRMILAAAIAVCLVISVFLPAGPPAAFWIVLLVILCASMLISLPKHFYRDRLFYRSLWHLPVTASAMLAATWRIRKASGTFIVTTHEVTDTNELHAGPYVKVFDPSAQVK